MNHPTATIQPPLDLEAMWQNSLIRASDQLTIPPVVLRVDEAIIGTLGNFSVSTGKAKAKKTFNVCALVAAALINGQVPNAVHLQLSQETKTKIKEHQLFVLTALEESSKKLDPKFEALQKLLSEQQKPVVFKSYSLFASVRLAERILLGLVCGLVMVSCWFFSMGAHELETASDYDLRYRYLRMQGKATTSDFAHLDTIFLTNRNPKVIRQMQQKVIDYEQGLQRQAKYYSR